MRILIAQMNPTIGDLKGNTEKILRSIENGRKQGVDLVVFPEMALTGYPAEDFVLLPNFMESVAKHLERIVQASKDIGVIVGLPRYNPSTLEKECFNSAAMIVDQSLVDYVDKMLLPTYDVFDERRYFEPGNGVKIWSFKGECLGITICEDLWQHSGLIKTTYYRRDPIDELKKHHPTCLINLSASPYSLNKFKDRMDVCSKVANTLQCPLVLCNQVGGNDSLIFDGYSLYVTPKGLIHHAKGFGEDEFLVDLKKSATVIHVERNAIEDLYHALVLGVRDYFHKLGFKKGCLGLSGGIDSAVVACIAAEALGKENLLGISMPSRYTVEESKRDARLLAERLEIEFQEIPIDTPFICALDTLEPYFAGKQEDITEENLQARIRGILLMAFSNKFHLLVLSTGNKSELALGYSTLYGDMCGGLAVIGDVTKTNVYALARWINRKDEIIPQYTIDRPPSAELRPNQKDSDTLPPYDVIDLVLPAYVEDHRSPEWIAEHYQLDLNQVIDLVKKIHANEYKRRQAPPALRVSEKAFSVGRRFPIVQRWV